jgi:uncharacterized membrane protein (UPF0182 family)
VGPIVGGVTGGIVLVALIVAVAIFVTLKRKTREKLPGQRTHVRILVHIYISSKIVNQFITSVDLWRW